jgi:single-strand DNA-binding protein
MNGVHVAVMLRLGADAEQRFTQAGAPLLQFSGAVLDAKAPDDTPAEWIRVTCFGELATSLAERLPKGTEVYVEGRLRLERWTARDGQPRSGLAISAWTVQPLGQIGRRAPRRRDELAWAG